MVQANTRRVEPPPSALRDDQPAPPPAGSEQEKAGTSSRRPFSLPGEYDVGAGAPFAYSAGRRPGRAKDAAEPGILRIIPSEIDSDFPGHARPKALN